MIHFDDKESAVTTGPGVTRQLLARGGGMMAVEFSFKQGSVGALHSHPHEQIGYVVGGRFEFEMDGKKTLLGPGDTYYVRPNAVHGVVCLEDGALLDVFTPQRDDFLPQ